MIQDTKQFKRVAMLQVVASSIAACNSIDFEELYRKVMHDFKLGLDRLKCKTNEERHTVVDLLSKSDEEIRTKYKRLNKKKK